PEMRVSLPISTVGWASVRLSTRPTAWARRSTKSGVMGAWPTVPRMPSVPKYWRAMKRSPGILRLCNRAIIGARAAPSTRSAPHLQRLDGLAHVVHAHDVRAALHRKQGRGHTGAHAIGWHLDAGDGPQRRLARPAREQRIAVC